MSPPPVAANESPSTETDSAMSAQNVQPETTGINETNATTPALMNSAMGLKPKRLFDKRIFSDSKRLDRVEGAVQQLYDDVVINTNQSQSKINSLQKELNTLKSEIETLRAEQEELQETTQAMLPDNDALASAPAQGEPEMLSPQAKSAAATIAATTSKPTAPPSMGERFTVRNIRFGDHATTTRIVLDIDGKPNFDLSLDNVEKVLLVELPGSAWTARTSGTPKSRLISSFSIQSMGPNKGNMLVISLKHVTEIVAKQVLPPSSGYDYRLVIDLHSNDARS